MKRMAGVLFNISMKTPFLYRRGYNRFRFKVRSNVAFAEVRAFVRNILQPLQPENFTVDEKFTNFYNFFTFLWFHSRVALISLDRSSLDRFLA